MGFFKRWETLVMKATEAQEHFADDVLLSPTSLLCLCSGCFDAMLKHFLT